MEYQTKVISTELEAENTQLIVVEKPKGFKFTAGQFVKLIFPQIKSKDPLANWRWFSIASAPSEKDLLFACRGGQSDFKKTCLITKAGDPIAISEAKGKFVLPKDAKKPIVFLVGGVGITPVRSMIVELIKEKSNQKMTLFYSNYRPEDVAFKDELDNLQNKNFRIIHTMTEPEKSKEKWEGETGFIDIEMIKHYVKDINQPLYYIVGSPGFCKAMLDLLEKAKIPKENLVLEKFTGL